MIHQKVKNERMVRRKKRIRAVIHGTAKRPRMSVFRSNRALYVQLIDDDKGVTLLSRSTRGKNIEAAKRLGAEVAKGAKEQKILTVVFDRGGNRYHGVIEALANAAREGGLTF